MALVNLVIFMRSPNCQIKITVNISAYTVCESVTMDLGYSSLKDIQKYMHSNIVLGLEILLCLPSLFDKIIESIVTVIWPLTITMKDQMS